MEKLKSSRFEIDGIYMFGSFASGVPTPKSDVDILVVAENLDPQALSPYFLSVTVPVDLHVMTPKRFLKAQAGGRGIAGAAVKKGVRLL